MSITKNSVNGWKFWECKLPGKQHWQSINTLPGRKLTRPLTDEEFAEFT
jgi:hypothetical protein